MLSSPFLGTVVAVLTWPVAGLSPPIGLDPSWVIGLYMAAERGMDFGTQIVFTYGPLGFLTQPSVAVVWLGRLAFLWAALVQTGVCIALLWASRRAFGLVAGLFLTGLAAVMAMADPVLIPVTVVGIAVLSGDWSPRARIRLAICAGALAGLELLASLRGGPTLVLMAMAVLFSLPDRRRTAVAFFGSFLLSFSALWLAAGQGLGNLDDYAVNTASIVGDFSTSMVWQVPSFWWQLPGMIVGLGTVCVLCVAAAWRLDNARRAGLAIFVGAVTFLAYKHAVVRESPGGDAALMGALLGIGLALTPHVRRALAIGATLVLVGITWFGMRETHVVVDLRQRTENFTTQLGEMAIPGRAGDIREDARAAMREQYGLSAAQLALLRSGSVHIGPWETAVAWAYDLEWDPLPVFQQYAAYNRRLDELNAAKLESATAPKLILWGNVATFEADGSDFPGAIDSRRPAFESPAAIVQMFCRYRAERWDEHWAILHRAPSRCGPERHLETVVARNGEAVRLPPSRPDEALLVRVGGLSASETERLRALLARAASRHVYFEDSDWSLVGETAGDGLLLRVPRWADYPNRFAFDSESATVAFERAGGFLTGVDGSTELTLSFSALPLRAPALLGAPGAIQKRRVQR
jgi:hypothetical protein